MGDIMPFFGFAVIIAGIFFIRRNNKQNLHRYYEILSEFKKNGKFQEPSVLSYKYETQLELDIRTDSYRRMDELITTYYGKYFIKIFIDGADKLEISMKGTCSAGPYINIIWELVELRYSSMKHIGYHLAVQAAEIFSQKLSTDYYPPTYTFSRKIPIERTGQYNRDVRDSIRDFEAFHDL